MWSLLYQNKTQEDVMYIPVHRQSIQIGSLPSSDLCISLNSSISKRHAKITVNRNNNTPNRNSVCRITDLGSTNGTFVIRKNIIQLTPLVPFDLNSGDKIRFGQSNGIWTAKFTEINILTCDDHNDNKKKKKFVRFIEKLGGRVFSEYSSECTHYCSMCNRVTPKFVFAVINNLPITGTDYWEKFQISVQRHTPLPNIDEYITANDCLPKIFKNAPLNVIIDRKKLFNKLNFLFFSISQLNKFGFIIQAAGGQLQLYQKFMSEQDILQPDIIIVDCYPDRKNLNVQLIEVEKKEYKSLKRTLHKKNIRMISCIEILGAIFYGSLEQYCNPIVGVENSLQIPRKIPKKHVHFSQVLSQDENNNVTPGNVEDTQLGKKRGCRRLCRRY
ncbi:nibrin isoform X3 [Cotesia typhae]|uniref:nibrin isoform X3 n=1 Tax=Cotesia typhae TaxID=2053667 RepID=UPI003D6825F4